MSYNWEKNTQRMDTSEGKKVWVDGRVYFDNGIFLDGRSDTLKKNSGAKTWYPKRDRTTFGFNTKGEWVAMKSDFTLNKK